ncbi:MAG: arginase family protein [Saprospiraceae bacterium]|nr:arginase family protein [Saprospiraceae bacterium]
MLESWLKPLNKDFLPATDYAGHQVGHSIARFTGGTPNLRGIRVAIIGLEENPANEVRKQLYALADSFGDLDVMDLGNIRKVQDDFIAPLVQDLMEGGIVPILLGHKIQTGTSQFFAHKAYQSSVSMLVVDEKIRYDAEKTKTKKTFLNPIFANKRTGLFHCSILGFQRHFTDPEILNYLDSRNFDYLRLGETRSDLTSMEPIIRDADFMSFHIGAISGLIAPGQDEMSPNGFSGEEACQIARYAGYSDKLGSFGIYGFNPELDLRDQTAILIAQMVWYFIDGVKNRKMDFPASVYGLTEYIVDFKDQDITLSFWKSMRTGRWWIQVPLKTKKNEKRHRLIPCSFSDYQLALKEELPERLMNAFKRFE